MAILRRGFSWSMWVLGSLVAFVFASVGAPPPAWADKASPKLDTGKAATGEVIPKLEIEPRKSSTDAVRNKAQAEPTRPPLERKRESTATEDMSKVESQREIVPPLDRPRPSAIEAYGERAWPSKVTQPGSEDPVSNKSEPAGGFATPDKSER